MALDKTPLQLALERDNGEIDYCDQCGDVRIVNGVGYCGVSGKMLHPLMFERGQGYGPARHCDKRRKTNEANLQTQR